MRNATRQLLPMLVLSAALPVVAQAADVKLNGFVDLTYMLSDGTVPDVPGVDTVSEYERKFDVSGEIDVNAVLGNKMAARIDLDLGKQRDPGSIDIDALLTAIDTGTVDLTAFGGGTDSGRFEQAFMAWESTSGIMFRGGLMNNPLGWEAEDAPDKYQISSGQLYDIWNGTTALNGNNVLGFAVSGKAGAVTVTGALLNDLLEVDEQNSFMGVVNFKPDNQIEVEAGFVTQDAGFETIIDFNATFTQGLFMLGGEVMLPSEVVDMAVGVTGTYKMTDQISGVLRFDNVGYASDQDDSRTITFGMSYMLDKSLMANAEVKIFNGDEVYDAKDGDQVMLEMIATF